MSQTKNTGQAKVIHRPEFSKDVSDCVAAVCYQLAGDSFDNAFEAAKLTFSTKREKKDPNLMPTEEVGFDRGNFMQEVRGRKKGWGGLSSLKLS